MVGLKHAAITAVVAATLVCVSSSDAVRTEFPGVSRWPVCWFASCYDYVDGEQLVDAAGATVRMLQADPAVKPGVPRSHSLQELDLQSASQKEAVEIGWIVDLNLNGDTRPHLFVDHWVNGVAACYDGCGFVQVSRTVAPRMALRIGAGGAFAIENRAGDWWTSYDGVWFGYFPGALWRGTFTRAHLVQAFGEVAHADQTTCEQMGDGRYGTSPHSSWIADYTLIGSRTAAAFTLKGTRPSLYDGLLVTRAAFRLGGPGRGSC